MKMTAEMEKVQTKLVSKERQLKDLITMAGLDEGNEGVDIVSKCKDLTQIVRAHLRGTLETLKP